MTRSTLTRRLLAGVLLFGACSPALAEGLAVTLKDQRDNTLGTDASPLVTRPPAGQGNAKVDQGGQGTPTSPWFVQLYLGGNPVGSSNPFPIAGIVTANLGTTDSNNLATLVARTPPLGQATKAGSQPVTIASDQGPLPVADPNNAAYSAAGSTFATGATVTAGRALYLNCSASGSVTMSLSGGGSIAWPISGSGPYTLPFAVTSVSADTASCTHQNIN